MKRLLQAYILVLEAEEMEIRPPPVMRAYRSNEPAEQHQQPSIEETSTQEDSSLIDLPAANNQPIPPIPGTREEKSEFISICNRGEFFVESEEIEQTLVLEEISPAVEISEEMDQSLKE